MNKNLKGKVVVIIGATGGLGQAFANAFLNRGATLILAGRNKDGLAALASRIGQPVMIKNVDITRPDSIEQLYQQVNEKYGQMDILVNAAGCDVRKALIDHDLDEVKRVLDVNLLGSVLVTKIALPYLNPAVDTAIVHIGGFADGRLAFPYYSVDVASRAGLFSFIESLNRELALEKSKIKVTYFCPSPADTGAERPFHPLWKKMGIAVVSPDVVAQALLKTIGAAKNVGIMGGFSTVFFAKLNSVFPVLADVIIMKSYGKMLREFLYGAENRQNNHAQPGLINRIAIFLVVLSFVLYGLIFVVPFLPLSLTEKAVWAPILAAGGEVSWWVGVAIVGKQALEKYKEYLNPCSWASCIRNSLGI
jgi:short-subunit dehydrogenase